MTKILQDQYALVKGARQVLLLYCETITREDFLRAVPFAGKSIRDLLVHVASVYRFWLEGFGLNKKEPFFDVGDITDIDQVTKIYVHVDAIVETFLKQFENQFTDSLTQTIPRSNKAFTTTPFTLLTHVMSHEFHHKGQILSMSRNLGYTPVDTDIIRFEN